MRRPLRLEHRGQHRGSFPFLRSVGLGGPFRGDLVVDRDESRFAADGQADVGGFQAGVDLLPQCGDRRPGGFGVGQGHPGVLMNPGDGVGELEGGLGDPGGPTDRRGRRGVRGGGQWDVALPREQPRGRIQPDPTRPGHVHLGPGMQVGEIRGRTGRPVDGLHIGGQLHQIARDKAGGQTEPAQRGDQHPGRITTGPDPRPQGVVRCLDARFHPHAVVDVSGRGTVDTDQEVDRAHPRGPPVGVDPRLQQLSGAGLISGVVAVVDRTQVRFQILPQRFRVIERHRLGVLLDEEVERVDDLHVGDQADVDAQLAGGVGKDQAGQKVSEGILLPVDEVVGRLDLQRVSLDGGAGVRSRAQPHHVRMYLDESVEGVAGAVLDPDSDSHSRQSHQ